MTINPRSWHEQLTETISNNKAPFFATNNKSTCSYFKNDIGQVIQGTGVCI